jgi:hypothetical protein
MSSTSSAYNFINLTWDDIVSSYKNEPILKNRPRILVDLKDDLGRKYNAIVVNTYEVTNNYNLTKNRYVHIRYLDNPKYKLMYWWTGNPRNKPGLDIKNKDDIDSKLGIDIIPYNEYVLNGYDDLINFDLEPKRFYKTISLYPYLNGLYGNIYVHELHRSIV